MRKTASEETNLSSADKETGPNTTTHDDHLNMAGLEGTTKLPLVLFGSLTGVVEYLASLGRGIGGYARIDDVELRVFRLRDTTGGVVFASGSHGSRRGWKC